MSRGLEEQKGERGTSRSRRERGELVGEGV